MEIDERTKYDDQMIKDILMGTYGTRFKRLFITRTFLEIGSIVETTKLLDITEQSTRIAIRDTICKVRDKGNRNYRYRSAEETFKNKEYWNKRICHKINQNP